MSLTLDEKFDEIPFQLFSISLGFQRLVRSVSRKSGIEEGLSPGMAGIYFALLNSKECIMKDLGSSLNMPKATLSGLISGMEKIGWVERNPSEQDGRAISVRLTRKARRMEPVMQQFHRSMCGILGECLSSRDSEELKRLLSKVGKSIDQELKQAQNAAA